MLQSRRFENLRDTQDVRLKELMQSIPNSFGQTSHLVDKSQRSLISPETSESGKRRGYIQRNKQAQRKVQMQNGSLETNYDRSTRQLFSMTGSIDSNQVASQGDSRGDTNSSDHSQIPKEENNLKLKGIIRKYKIKSIVANFIQKVKRISVSSKPVLVQREDVSLKGLLWQETCIELPQFAENIFSLLSIIQVLALSIVISMSLVFKPLRQSHFVGNFQIISFFLCFFDLLQNLFTVRSTSGKKIRVLKEIWDSYLQGGLITDTLTVLIILLNCFIANKYLLCLETVIFLKLPQALDKVQRLEVYWIKNLYNQQYWSLVKIIISNFCFAHVISILLAAMVGLSPQQNWMTQKGIGQAEWQQQYIWSYYWASTMMLTIGFGDIVASNSSEALCLIFIETFSCLVFAYNINCIGTLIQHIRSQDAEKSKRSKIFKKLTKQNRLNEQLSWKINNYIQENAELRKRFNFEQEKEFISNLPVELKKQYLKQSNKKIFEHIQFFKSFISKTLYNLAERIEMRVSHPDQVIQKYDDDYNLIILKEGQLGFFCKNNTFNLKDYVMNIKTVHKNDHPYLLNLDFIVKKRPYYQIRSIQYCIFFFMDYNSFIQAIRDSTMDYEYYCGLRDKMKSVPDQFELIKCETCDSKHIKAVCPRLHFIPYNYTVIHKYLHKVKTAKNNQFEYRRKRIYKANAFKIYKMVTDHVQKLGALLNTKRRRQYTILPSISENQSESDFSSNTEIKMQREIKQIQQRYRNFSYEIIKEEINKMKKYDHEEDQVWILKLDRLHDFNNYFSKDNPASIGLRFLKGVQNFSKDAPGTVIIQQIRQAFSSQHQQREKQLSLRRSIKTKSR